jgi:hypothetical protein
VHRKHIATVGRTGELLNLDCRRQDAQLVGASSQSRFETVKRTGQAVEAAGEVNRT